MIQIITGSIIIIIGIYVFMKYPVKRDTKSLVLAALFVVIAAILKRLSIMVPLFGVPALKLGFEIIPMMLAGMILSPSYGFLVGIAVDIVGLIVTPTGFPFLGFTLNSVIMSCLPAIILDKTKRLSEKKLEQGLIALISIIIGFISIYVLLLDTVTVSEKIVEMTWFYKIGIISICFILSILLWRVIHYMKKKVHHNNLSMLYIWIIIVIVTEISVTFLLTPYWLQVMYEIPFMVSLFVRVIKQCVMIPLDIIVGYQLLKALKKI
ncbi:MAG: folate family ECF transporter S component [Coprobacillaceae bacterium]